MNSVQLLLFLAVVLLGTQHVLGWDWRISKKKEVRASTDTSSSEFLFTTQTIPSDARYMTSVGNGHVATHVFSDAVYMNGLYNGDRGQSHRARIPAYCNIRIDSTSSQDSTNYTLDSRRGLFLVEAEDNAAEVEQVIFAHKFYTRAIVNLITIRPKGGSMDVGISLESGNDSDDIVFNDPSRSTIVNRVVWESCGRTKEVEDARYQTETSTVCVFWTEVPASLEVTGDEETFMFVMTADSRREVALKEITDVLQETQQNLYRKHVTEWMNLYNSGNIEIQGNLELSKVVSGIYYYLLSSLPSENSNQDQGKFYGLSPGGLSRGNLNNDYQGHSFWDTETWMFPGILVMFPNLAKRLLEYRSNGIIPAAENAANTGYKGIRFPWESGFTGAEVTPDCCQEGAIYEQHITACIAFAARQFIAMTGDDNWLEKAGCNLTRKIAEFWASRVEFNEKTGFNDIRGVMGPDEDHYNVTNSVFTNVAAGLAMYLGEYTSCLCDGDTSGNEGWSSIAANLALLHDAELDYHPQFEGYERPTVIKQADVVLLGFPLLYKMNASTRMNDLLYYENVTRATGPAMTWSMHTIGHLRLGDYDQATRLFNRSYKNYFREPFKIWMEAIFPLIGAVNFITGMGGFLQTLLFGYGGMSIYLDRLEILNPQLPPDTTALSINGIKYLGSALSLHVNETHRWLEVKDINVNRPIVLESQLRDGETLLQVNMTVPLEINETYHVRLLTPDACPLPKDVIGQPNKRRLKTNPKG